jgi:phage shock protein PspC (stress-responsive transcriptional regulator)
MLARNENKSWVAGVAAGMAEEYEVSVVWTRLFFIITFFMFGIGLALYAYYWNNMPGTHNQLRMDFT